MPSARITDIGCGDFNIGRHIHHFFCEYVACDVVPELIERNKVKFRGTAVDFKCLDITSDPLPPGDIALVREVLQHLSNAQIAKFLHKVGEYKILVITEHLPIGEFVANIDKPTGVGIRAHGMKRSGVDILKPPFNFKCKSFRILCEISRDADNLRTTAYFL
jgi:hypothetical protein